jgi:hypothetical protein
MVERRAILGHEGCSSAMRGKEQGKQQDMEETERTACQKDKRRNDREVRAGMTDEQNR